MGKEENLKIPSEILEPSILVHSLNDVSFFLKIKPYLDTSGKRNKTYFNDEKYQTIFNLISKWYDKYYKFPTKKELQILNEKLNKEDEELCFLTSTIINKIFDEDPGDVDKKFLERETLSFIQENRVYEAMMLSQMDISSGNFGAIADRMRDAISINFDKDLGISIRDINKSFELLNELNSENTISTGIPSLDAALDGGWRSREIYIFSSIPSLGKCCRGDTKVLVSYEIDDETGEII